MVLTLTTLLVELKTTITTVELEHCFICSLISFYLLFRATDVTGEVCPQVHSLQQWSRKMIPSFEAQNLYQHSMLPPKYTCSCMVPTLSSQKVVIQ